MLTHKSSKFLFYDFNNDLNRINEPIQFIRYTKIRDHYTLNILQEKRPDFIKKILEVSLRDLIEIENLDTAVDIEENKIIVDKSAI